MNIAVFGTGIVGQVIASRLNESGNQVSVGTRNVELTLLRTKSDRYGNPPIGEWLKQNQGIKLGTFAQAAAASEIIFNCTVGAHSIEAIQEAGEANLKGKILADVSNPLDFSNGMPPSLSIVNTDSLGETIQRTFPDLKVVKTLNTMNCNVMVNPSLVPGDHNVFVSGNDDDAKNKVKEILISFGWKDKNIIDLGDITAARGTEQLLPIWLRLYSKFKTGRFNFNVVAG